MAKISVLIPTYNRAKMISIAIESVLNQRNVEFELVVSDNCSTDETEDVVRKYLIDSRVKYYKTKANIGMVNNWRRLVYELAENEWLILLSDDDHFTDEFYLSKVSDAVDKFNPVFVYAGGVVADIVNNSNEVLTLPFEGLVKGVDVFRSRGQVKPYDILFCNVAFKKSDAIRLGFLDNEYNLSSDSEFYLKLCSEGHVFAIKDPVCVYMKHGENVTKKINSIKIYYENNVFYIINPYVYAKSLGVSSTVLSEYCRNVNIKKYVANLLIRLWVNDKKWHDEFRCRLLEIAPEIVFIAESGLVFRFKKIVAFVLFKLRIMNLKLS